MFEKIKNHLKNIPGWKSKTKYVVFSVDDYGNVGISNDASRKELEQKGILKSGRFNRFDALDTTNDLNALFEVLSSVKDRVGNNAIFTTYAVPENINFRKTLDQNKLVTDKLNQTYEFYESINEGIFKGAFDLVLEGIDKKLMRPQFHGKEHLNSFMFNQLMASGNKELLTNLQLNSISDVDRPSNFKYSNLKATYSFESESHVDYHMQNLSEGLISFKEVYGYESLTFAPPAFQLHPKLFKYLEERNVIGIDKGRTETRHLGDGKFIKEKNVLGEEVDSGHYSIVRNCMFEPNSRKLDWVKFTMDQIEAAFFWGKPAIISSHRVNFCGLLDENNRTQGLKDLKKLLNAIVNKWPDVQFITADELVLKMQNKN